jgi:hypothetical protein
MPSNNNGAFAALGLATAALVGASLLGGDEQQPPAAPASHEVAAPQHGQPQGEEAQDMPEGRRRAMEAKRRQQEWATARRAQRAEKARRDAERGRPQ